MNPRYLASKITKDKPHSMREVGKAIHDHSLTMDIESGDDQAIMGVLNVAMIKLTTQYDFTQFTRYVTWKKLLRVKKNDYTPQLDNLLDELL